MSLKRDRNTKNTLKLQLLSGLILFFVLPSQSVTGQVPSIDAPLCPKIPQDDRQITICGQVNRPGLYPITETTIEDHWHSRSFGKLLGAVREANGFSSQADITQIKLRRLVPGSPSKTVTLNLWPLIQSFAFSRNDYVLQPGDQIFVPTAVPRQKQLSSSSTIQVRMIGEVAQPGLISIETAGKLKQVLGNAGKAVSKKKHSIYLFRLNSDGSMSYQAIGPQKFKELPGAVLKNNDVLLFENFSRRRPFRAALSPSFLADLFKKTH